jgi:hypothetical protein
MLTDFLGAKPVRNNALTPEVTLERFALSDFGRSSAASFVLLRRLIRAMNLGAGVWAPAFNGHVLLEPRQLEVF